jgi:hypothetical protein
MATEWSVSDYLKLIPVTTGCLCLLLLVSVISVCTIKGTISPEILGTMKGAGIGGGLIGFAYILYLIIKVSLSGGK